MIIFLLLFVSFFSRVYASEQATRFASTKLEDLQCMLLCSQSLCRKAGRALWCLTHCIDSVYYSDLKGCATYFLKECDDDATTCADQLTEYLGKDFAEGAALFCVLIKQIYIQPRDESNIMKKGLIRKALLEVEDLRKLRACVVPREEKNDK